MDRKGITLVEVAVILFLIFVLWGIFNPLGSMSPEQYRRVKEASTKGNLGALRSALNIYFSGNKCYPARGTLSKKPFVGTMSENYIDEIPAATENCELFKGFHENNKSFYKEFHEKSKNRVEDVDLGGRGSENGGWAYFTPVGSICPTVARICVNCAQLDSKGTVISTW